MPAQDIISGLIAANKLTQAQADKFSTEALNSGTSLEELLLTQHIVSQEDYARAKAESLGIPFVTLAGRAITPDVINFIPEPVARRYTLVPFQMEGKDPGTLS